MKICQIIDEFRNDELLGYLFYFEKSKVFAIELSPLINTAQAPIFLASFAARGILTMDPEWSERWVESRIIPRDRQNLGEILRENGLDHYDSFRLLMLAEGRCSQDDCAVKPVKERDIPEWVRARRQRKVTFAAKVGKDTALISFADGSVRKTNLEDAAGRIEVFPGGLGIRTEKGGFLQAESLYESGELIPMSADELRAALAAYIIDTSDMCKELGCSRQYIDQLTRRNEITTIKKSGNTRIYPRSDAERLKD